MKIFCAEFTSEETAKESQLVFLDLPAVTEEMVDALDRARIYGDATHSATGIEPIKQFGFLEEHLAQKFNLYELNHLAQRLENLDDFQTNCFEGLVKMEEKKQKVVPISTLINLTHNLADVIYVPIDTDAELGQFYADNDFIEELDKLPDSIYEKLDFAKIGKEMREREGGIFTPNGYVVNNGEIKQIYNGEYPIPEPPDYVFLLEIAEYAKGDQPNYENIATLKLPVTTEMITEVLKQIDENSLQECIFYECKSMIPQLNHLCGDRNDFENLNHLAKQIERLESQGELITYKAMLQVASSITL